MENRDLLLVVLIAALLVTVGMQTVQLAALSSTGASVAVPSAGATKTSTSAASAPANLQNLPSMVGGC